MGILFAEEMCFDSSLEGNGGPSGGVPHCAKVRAGWHCGMGAEQSEGPERTWAGGSDPMIEAGTPSTGPFR
jgi:hypothetical protein